ncbi:hypothetical protein EG327_006963 [Venturia inaequalis]|uniref:Uncharacterized protein n=1 Tax=Venturia inaequalis TaxID=5025 RepID=A0A8H3ZBK7_VENIN|nr:hypothetical protein EG327_006963 [Venturia inaequalis]
MKRGATCRKNGRKGRTRDFFAENGLPRERARSRMKVKKDPVTGKAVKNQGRTTTALAKESEQAAVDRLEDAGIRAACELYLSQEWDRIRNDEVKARDEGQKVTRDSRAKVIKAYLETAIQRLQLNEHRRVAAKALAEENAIWRARELKRLEKWKQDTLQALGIEPSSQGTDIVTRLKNDLQQLAQDSNKEIKRVKVEKDAQIKTLQAQIRTLTS